MEQIEPKENQSPETEQETKTNEVPEPEGTLLGFEDIIEPCPCPCPCPCDDEE